MCVCICVYWCDDVLVYWYDVRILECHNELKRINVCVYKCVITYHSQLRIEGARAVIEHVLHQLLQHPEPYEAGYVRSIAVFNGISPPIIPIITSCIGGIGGI